MNVVPQAIKAQIMMDLRINRGVSCKKSESRPMTFVLCVSPSKEMEERTRKTKDHELYSILKTFLFKALSSRTTLVVLMSAH